MIILPKTDNAVIGVCDMVLITDRLGTYFSVRQVAIENSYDLKSNKASLAVFGSDGHLK